VGLGHCNLKEFGVLNKVVEPTEIRSAGRWPDGDGPLRKDSVATNDEALIVDVGGFEGPLDLLLELARHHKIDLAQISILALAEQFLAYIDNARKMRIEVAADYLVMAAWLAYLKSRMLIPAPPGSEEVPPEHLAARLAFRLQRLQAMRDASAKLMALNLFGRDVFGRGNPEPLVVETQRAYSDNLIDLLKAYAERRQRKASHQSYQLKRHATFSIKEARMNLERMVGSMDDWGTFDAWLVEYLVAPDMRRSVWASSFTASLELVREGRIELRQEDAFRPIYMRRRA
jgi:segregation and condensation protein A